MERLYNGVFRVDWPCMANVRRIDQGALPMVLDMNRTGVLVDPDHFRRLGAELGEKARLVEADIARMVGRPVNPNSGDQVAALLFGDLKLEPPHGGKLTKTGARMSVDDDVLSSLLAHHPVVEKIVRGRELTKIKGTYCDAFPLHVCPDGRIRTTFKMYTARTGRLASENPNLQNVGVRTEEGRQVRAGFIARPGCVLSSHDLSQIEMVWAAELSQDPVMMEVYAQGQDLHVRTACALFGLDYDRISGLWRRYKKDELTGRELEEMREFEIYKRLPAKTLGFAILYGVTAQSLQVQILVAGGPLLTVEECDDYIRRWFELFEGVRVWLELQYSRVRRYGMNWTAFGRPRVIPEIHSALQGVRNKALRQAGNHPDQGSAGDHLKLAMAEIQDGPVTYFRSYPGVVCDPVLQIHDELIFELSREIVDDFNPWVATIMQTAVRPMGVRVKSSCMTAPDWGSLK